MDSNGGYAKARAQGLLGNTWSLVEPKVHWSGRFAVPIPACMGGAYIANRDPRRLTLDEAAVNCSNCRKILVRK